MREREFAQADLDHLAGTQFPRHPETALPLEQCAVAALQSLTNQRSPDGKISQCWRLQTSSLRTILLDGRATDGDCLTGNEPVDIPPFAAFANNKIGDHAPRDSAGTKSDGQSRTVLSQCRKGTFSP